MEWFIHSYIQTAAAQAGRAPAGPGGIAKWELRVTAFFSKRISSLWHAARHHDTLLAIQLQVEETKTRRTRRTDRTAGSACHAASLPMSECHAVDFHAGGGPVQVEASEVLAVVRARSDGEYMLDCGTCSLPAGGFEPYLRHDFTTMPQCGLGPG